MAFDARCEVTQVGRAETRSGADDTVSRWMDILVATAGLIFVLPLMTTVALLLYVFDPGPIWFVQTRIGRGGRPFYCIKFRTMAVDAEARLERLLAADPEAAREWRLNQKLAYDPRITRLGAFLRSSSLDELPQLINVIRGEMSLVGPRPIVQAEANRYGRYFAYYCDVRPGLTGMWQVLGRGRVSYRRRVAMDVLYVRKRSIWMNLWLIIATIPAVLLRKGAA